MAHTYTDLSHNYLIDPGDAVVYDVDAILESVKNILSTPYYSRLFNRGFGSRISAILFMPVTQSTADLLLSNIVSALSLEPRIYVDQKNSYVNAYPDRHAYDAQIKFVILFNGSIGQFNHTFLAMQ